MIGEHTILTILNAIDEPAVFIATDEKALVTTFANKIFFERFKDMFVASGSGYDPLVSFKPAVQTNLHDCCMQLFRSGAVKQEVQLPGSGKVKDLILCITLLDKGNDHVNVLLQGKHRIPYSVTQKELLKLNERTIAAQKIAGIGLWEYDLTTDYIFWSSEMYKMWELPPGTTPLSLAAFQQTIHPEDRPGFEKYMQDVLAGTYNKSFDYRMVTPSLKTVFIRQELHCYCDENGHPLFLRGVVMDITAKKLVSLASAFKTTLVKVAADIHRELIKGADWGTTIQSIITLIGSIFPQHLLVYIEHWGQEEPLTFYSENFDGTKNTEALFSAVRQLVSVQEQQEIFTVPGSLIGIQEHIITILPLTDNKIIRGVLLVGGLETANSENPETRAFLLTIGQAIVMAKQRQLHLQALAALNRQYLSVISNVPGITYRCLPDQDWTMLFISQEVARMTGYEPEEFTDRRISFASIIFPEDDKADSAFIEAELGRNGTFLLNYRIRCADGRTLWVEDRGLGIYDDDGRLLYIDGLILDITEKRSINEKFRSVFNNSSDCMLILNATGKVKEYNIAAKRLVQPAKRPVHLNDMLWIEHGQNNRRYPLFDWLFSEKPVTGQAYKFHTGAGTSFYGEIEYLKNIGPENDLVTITDVTPKKIQEDILKNSERRFKALIQEGSDVVFIMDRHGKLLFASDNVLKALGVHPEQVTGKLIYEYLHEDDRNHFRQYLQDLAGRQKVHAASYRIYNSDGNLLWFSSTLTNLEAEPSIGGIVVNSMNITEQMEYAGALRKANERFVQVLRTSNEAICDWDIMEDKVFWGQGFQEMFGFDLADYNNYLWSDNIHPDDKVYIIKKLNEALADPEKETFYAEYRFLRADGSVAMIEHRATFIRDQEGRAIRGIGAFRDVTDLRESHFELQARNKQLEKIAWMQSHLVRGPLAKITGLVSLLMSNDEFAAISREETLNGIIEASKELDMIIREIIKQSESIKEL